MSDRKKCCPVCQYERIKEELSTHGYTITCPKCGQFIITRYDRVNLSGARPELELTPMQLSALVYEQSLVADRRTVWLRVGNDEHAGVNKDYLKLVNLSELTTKWPRSVGSRLDRVLCNLARRFPNAGERIWLPSSDLSAVPLCFAADFDEALYYVRSLNNLRRLNDIGSGKDGITTEILPQGWDRIDQITRALAAPSNPVFVAMWFGVDEKRQPTDRTVSDMLEVYTHGIQPALRRAGYDATRADRAEHNEGIMDRVLGDINVAPFVVADFTGHRNGVYLEAGYARGLGRPVIHTCHHSELNGAHFDVKHINFICWKDAADLQERLYHRVRGTIGMGPFPPMQS